MRVNAASSAEPTTWAARLVLMSPAELLKLSAAGALITIALKLLAWWVSGSVGLLSDALESVVNLAGAIFALAMVTIAARPADEDHPFGHHKAEYFSSAFEGMLVLGAALAIVVAAVLRIRTPQPLVAVGWGVALSAASTVLNGALAWVLLRAGRHHRSIALEADGRHLVTDVWTSIGVIAGIAAVHFTGWLWLDPAVALGVAVNIFREGALLVWHAAQGLMDEAVEPDALAHIQETLDECSKRHGAALRIDHLRTRRAGQRRFADVHLHLPPHWTLGRAVALRGDLEAALMRAVLGLRASIQLLSSDTEAHVADDDPGARPAPASPVKPRS
jgi:cation diffusion facilitator family transporter